MNIIIYLSAFQLEAGHNSHFSCLETHYTSEVQLLYTGTEVKHFHFAVI